MIIKDFPIDAVIPYARNPRSNTSAIPKCAASLKEFGWQQPIVCDVDMTVVVGHTRLAAARMLGMTEVPVLVADWLTPAQAKAYRIADNRVGSEATFDFELLKLELMDLQALNFPLLDTGFDLSEMKEIMAEEKNLGDADDVPDAPVDPVTRKGDLWILGNHRLLCGDSTLELDVKTLMGTDKADLVWTDPPYNVAYVGKTEDAKTIQNDSMSDADFRSFLGAAFRAMASVMRNGAGFYVAHADVEAYNFIGAMQDAQFQVRQILAWVKNSMVMGRKDYHFMHEPILYGWKSGAAHSWHNDRKQTTVLNFDRPQRSAEHPTMKPSALVEYCIGNSSTRDQIVFDPFGGSGTTLIASEKTGRACRTIEIDPRYCDVIVARWESFSGLKASVQHAEEVVSVV